MKTIFFSSILIVALSHLASGEIVFENKIIETTADPEAKTIIVEFPFTVEGEATKITGYDAPCTCLAARVEPTNDDGSAKLLWQPGEKGKIVAKFEMGNFKGTVDKGIILNTDKKGSPHELILRVTIPVLLEIEPATHKWEIGGEADERVFSIKVQGDQPIKLIENSGTNSNFPYTLNTIKEGWEYQIKVKPISVTTGGFGMIRLKTDSENPKYQNEQVFLVIKEKP